jgi:hypothetical protein
MGITLSVSSSDGHDVSTSAQRYYLDLSTDLKQKICLDSSKISSDLNVGGEGNNRLMQSLSGRNYLLASEVNSQGRLSISASSSTMGEEAEMSQDVTGAGSLSINMQSWQSDANAGQEASVVDGILCSSQSLFAGSDQGAFSRQNTEIVGKSGKVISGALGEENVMLAEGGYYGQGSMKAVLASAASERAVASGFASIDDVVVLSGESINALSRVPESAMMGVSGLRMLGEQSDIGSFDASVFNFNLHGEKEDAKASASTVAASAIPSAGGSYSSFRLTGYRWNMLDPQIQLYLNPTNTPTSLTSTSSQEAVSAAANTWDKAVAGNLFKDMNTVIVDANKVVDDPFSSSPQKDGYNVHGWKSFGNSFVALNRWWTDGIRKDGYYNIIESDTWYNLDFGWTTDLTTAQTTSKIDLQSVALHELGHCIGLGDIYSTTYGGVLPPTDERTRDYDQVMNLYNGPQRLLGNGDITGAQTLYGIASSLITVGSGRKT